MYFNSGKKTLGILLLVLSSPFAILAQQAGIGGTITDQTGAVVPGAAITAKNVGTGLVREAVSKDIGQYSLPNLAVGVYQVTAEKQGFRRGLVDQVKLEVHSIRTVDIVLQVGEVTQEVSVTASPTPLETTQSTVGTLMENKMVNEIPLNGRNFLQLQMLLPGVTMGRTGTWSVVKIDSASTSIGGGNFNVNGMRDLYNDYLLDGLSFKEWIHGAAALNPSVDAVQEFKTHTSSYSADFGANAGGLVNMVTKAGTNDLHGTVYEFLRNDKLDAANFFTNRAGRKKEPFRRNQFGAVLGGPIRRDKTFFFGSYDGFREMRSRILFGTLPTASMRQGDFSELLSLPKPRTIHDPFTGVPYTNNTLPPEQILSIWSTFFRDYVPLPNVPGLLNNYIASRRRKNDVDQVIGRIDHQLSGKTTVSGRYVFNDIFDRPFRLFDNFFITQEARNQNLMLHASHAKSPTTILDYRGGYNLFRQDATGNRANTTPWIRRDILGMNGFLATDPRASDGPCLGPAEFTSFGCAIGSAPREWISERYEHHGAFYLVRGRHNIRGGFQAIRHHETFPEIFIPNGIYSFSGTFTGYGMADLLRGMPSFLQASPDMFDPQFRFWEIMPWIQDDWRVTPNLTLNLGVRYERSGRPISKTDDIAAIRLPVGSREAFIAVAAPCEVSAHHRCQTSLPVEVAPTRSTLQSDNNNFAPRIGFAYRIGGSDRTVLRGAYGIFYQREPINQNIFLSINPPFVGYYTVFNTIDNIQQFDFFRPLAGQPAGGLQFTYLPEDFRDAYLQAWNIGIQRDFGAGVVLDLSYVGNKDTHLVARTWPNQPAPGPGAVDARRPYTNVSQIAGNEPIGNSNYHGMQLKAEKRFSHGLSFLAAYTWSKAITDSQRSESGPWATADLQNARDFKANRGLFHGDARNRFTLSYLYELPFGQGKRYLSGAGAAASKVVSGWQVGGITTFQSGMPLSAVLIFDNPNVGEGSKFPDRIGDPNSGPKTVDDFFNASAFQLPPRYTFGNAGVGTITGPGINQFDLSIIKNTRITERFNLQFRTEFFNLANHLIMADPSTSFGTLGFGKVFGTRLDSREIQFALRLQF